MAKNNELDFSDLDQATEDELAVASTTGGSGPLGISVVNTAGNGKRVKLTKSLFETLGSPKKIQFATKGDYLYIGPTIPHSTVSVPFSSGKGTNIIYKSGFVLYLVEKFKLNFDTYTSIAFHDVDIIKQEFEGEEIVVAKIKMMK